jgi:hypothetical protein
MKIVPLNWKIAFKIEKDRVHEEPWLSIPFILQFLFEQRNVTFVHGAGIRTDIFYNARRMFEKELFGEIGGVCYMGVGL